MLDISLSSKIGLEILEELIFGELAGDYSKRIILQENSLTDFERNGFYSSLPDKISASGKYSRVARLQYVKLVAS